MVNIEQMRRPFLWICAIVSFLLLLVVVYQYTPLAPKIMQSDDSKSIAILLNECFLAMYFLNAYETSSFKLSLANIQSVPISRYLLILPSFFLMYVIDKLNTMLAKT